MDSADRSSVRAVLVFGAVRQARAQADAKLKKITAEKVAALEEAERAGKHAEELEKQAGQAAARAEAGRRAEVLEGS